MRKKNGDYLIKKYPIKPTYCNTDSKKPVINNVKMFLSIAVEAGMRSQKHTITNVPSGKICPSLIWLN